jgi:transcriptional regulator with XRE-family HTH domain
MLKKQIESLRIKQGWSQAELARRLHLSPSTVGMYEQGRREPPIDILVAMSEEFGVTIDYLVTNRICTLTDPRLITQSEQIIESISVLKNLSQEDLIMVLISKLLRP